MNIMSIGRVMIFSVIWAIVLGGAVDIVAQQQCNGVWGEVVSKKLNQQDGSIVEKVVIYPRKSNDCQDRIKRQGFLVRYPEAKATILISHGFMCDKYYAGSLQHFFPQGQYNVMAFDFRAHGDDIEGQYCTFGKNEAQDVIAAAHFLREHVALQEKPLYVYGFSMGAVAAIEAQAQDETLFNAMMLDCPFDSSEKLMKKGLKKFKCSVMGYEFDLPGVALLEDHIFHPYVQMLVKYAFKPIANLETKNIQTNIMPVNSVDSIKRIKVPCFLIHCKNDQHISVGAIRELYDSAGGSKRLWITNGRGHFDSIFYCPVEYSCKLKDFLNDITNGTLRHDAVVLEDPDDTALMAIASTT